MATGGDCQVCANDKVRSATLDECLDSCPQSHVQTTGSDTCEMATVCGEGQTLNRQNNTCEASSNDSDNDGVPNGSDNCPNTINTNQTNTDNDAMGDACDMDDDNDGVEDVNDACPTASLNPASGDASDPTADPDMDGCKNSEDDDDDNDDVPDMRDVFPTDACASADNDKDGMPDTLVADCTTSLTEDTDDDNDTELDTTDVDDDNDGLIDIATATELNNMRWNLAGTTYDDEEADVSPADTGSNAGGPALATDYCASATGGVYLCGYELVADIDFSDDGTGSPIDLSTDTMRNFNPIGNLSSGHFTAYLEGNGYTISGLDIDITGETAANNDANDAAFIASCQGVVSNLILSNAVINGRRRVAVLCATMNGGAARNVHIIDASIRQDAASTSVGSAYVGSLVGFMEDSSSISNSIATGDVSGSHSSNFLNIGGLVGFMEDSSSISNSIATGDVSGSASSAPFTGGLVGYMLSSSISNSIATGDVSVVASGGEPYTGGLVGFVGSSSSISNSTATGDVSASYTGMGSSYAGGLVGLMGAGSISNSITTGDVFSSCSHASSQAKVGGLVGEITAFDSRISNSAATGDVLASFTSEFFLGGLVGQNSGSISNSYYNSEAMQVRNGAPRGSALLRGVGSDASATGVTSQTLSQIQSLDASTLMWDDTKHWSGVGIDGNYPLLRYANNPHTSGVDECESLPGFGNTDDDKVRCGDLLPLQELYRASGNLTFSNATIGIPTSSAPDFFYSVDMASVTVTYNLATGVTLSTSRVEDTNGDPTNIVSWAQGTNAGTISGIEANETFWLALTFQQAGVTHKVRWKFVRPAS